MPTTKKRIMISLTDEQFADLQAAAQETGLTKSGWIVLALMDWKRRKSRRKQTVTDSDEIQ